MIRLKKLLPFDSSPSKSISARVCLADDFTFYICMRRVTHVSIVSRLLAVFVPSPCVRSPASPSPLLPFPLPQRHRFRFSRVRPLQSRYVMITALYTRESPLHVNRNHLRASTPTHANPWNDMFAGAEFQRRRRTRPNLRRSPDSPTVFSANLKASRSILYLVTSFTIAPTEYSLGT